ncbi:hypothetical protein ACE14D_04980 [Streptomyces sp. Act-28]
MMSYRAAAGMTGAPSSYPSTMIATSDMRPEWFDDVPSTHLGAAGVRVRR